MPSTTRRMGQWKPCWTSMRPSSSFRRCSCLASAWSNAQGGRSVLSELDRVHAAPLHVCELRRACRSGQADIRSSQVTEDTSQRYVGGPLHVNRSMGLTPERNAADTSTTRPPAGSGQGPIPRHIRGPQPPAIHRGGRHISLRPGRSSWRDEAERGRSRRSGGGRVRLLGGPRERRGGSVVLDLLPFQLWQAGWTVRCAREPYVITPAAEVKLT